MHGDPSFSFDRSLPLPILSILTKTKNIWSWDLFILLFLLTSDPIFLRMRVCMAFKYPFVRLIPPAGIISTAKIYLIGLFVLTSTHRNYLEFSILFFTLLIATKSSSPYVTKTSKNRLLSLVCFISETSTMTPNFLCLSAMSWSLSNCSKCLNKNWPWEDFGRERP